ncbi:hypothetical protein ACU686_26640 [Yinghuangia aomiensis]
MTESPSAPYRFPDDDTCDHANRTATYHPVADPDGIPAITVFGVMVGMWADADDGAIVVSINLETAAEEVTRPDDTVPLRVEIHGRSVFDDSEMRRKADDEPPPPTDQQYPAAPRPDAFDECDCPPVRIDREHRTATFHAYDPNVGLPALEYRGVRVYLGGDPDGQAVIVHAFTNQADDDVCRPDGTVPLRITVNGHTIHASGPERRQDAA